MAHDVGPSTCCDVCLLWWWFIVAGAFPKSVWYVVVSDLESVFLGHMSCVW